jgi:hypothetical protein
MKSSELSQKKGNIHGLRSSTTHIFIIIGMPPHNLMRSWNALSP